MAAKLDSTGLWWKAKRTPETKSLFSLTLLKCQMLNVGKRQPNLNLWRIQVSEDDKDRKGTIQRFKTKIQEKCLESK